jgi:hypothetical protein
VLLLKTRRFYFNNIYVTDNPIRLWSCPTMPCTICVLTADYSAYIFLRCWMLIWYVDWDTRTLVVLSVGIFRDNAFNFNGSAFCCTLFQVNLRCQLIV